MNRFLGFKTEEILTCLLLIVVGYFIAKMFSERCGCNGFSIGGAYGGSSCGGPYDPNDPTTYCQFTNDASLRYKCNTTDVCNSFTENGCNGSDSLCCNDPDSSYFGLQKEKCPSMNQPPPLKIRSRDKRDNVKHFCGDNPQYLSNHRDLIISGGDTIGGPPYYVDNVWEGSDRCWSTSIIPQPPAPAPNFQCDTDTSNCNPTDLPQGSDNTYPNMGACVAACNAGPPGPPAPPAPPPTPTPPTGPPAPPAPSCTDLEEYHNLFDAAVSACHPSPELETIGMFGCGDKPGQPESCIDKYSTFYTTCEDYITNSNFLTLAYQDDLSRALQVCEDNQVLPTEPPAPAPADTCSKDRFDEWKQKLSENCDADWVSCEDKAGAQRPLLGCKKAFNQHYNDCISYIVTEETDEVQLDYAQMYLNCN